jgi:hypothetical protein
MFFNSTRDRSTYCYTRRRRAIICAVAIPAKATPLIAAIIKVTPSVTKNQSLQPPPDQRADSAQHRSQLVNLRVMVISFRHEVSPTLVRRTPPTFGYSPALRICGATRLR